MAAIQHSRVAPFGAITTYRIVEAFERSISAVRAKFVADRTYRELSRLTPTQLRDIGLGEQDLTDFCRTAAGGRR